MTTKRNHNVSSHAPLQARIAGVALATTVLALVAACLCFMLQQWSVARQEARANHEVLVQMAAAGAAAPLADHNMVGVYRALEAVAKAPGVASARIIDAKGRTVAQLGEVNPSDVDTLRRPIKLSTQTIGTLVLVAKHPRLAQTLAPGPGPDRRAVLRRRRLGDPAGQQPGPSPGRADGAPFRRHA